MAKDNYIQMNGKVVDTLPGAKFKVELENGLTINCTISGKMRMNSIRVLLGDEVITEISTYDLTNGRIVRRL